ncbi:GNAT family N-acetyltransferase [Zhongshania aquimaris]|uniref:GNAT family N-acetyltransferase n=1 Tax=Zhongshania aquimaris TaxID=2857107 RepID=A0ABS6VXJ0_9GAMM|nr:GNAT family N-acetyltransferase [Zhongshania aquimaris]
MQIAKTARLILRHLSLEDVPALTDILSDPEVMKYSINGVCDEAATREFIEWCLSCYESHGVGPWALIDKKSSELIGFCSAGPEMVADIEEINLGYRIAKRYWNKGLASESATAVLNYVFGEHKFTSVVVIIEPAHVASLKVAEKIGFSNYDVLEFHSRPVRLYRLTSKQWKTLRHKESS